MTAKKSISTNQAPQAIGPYSQAVLANGLLFCSGQIAMDPQSGELVPGGIKKECEQIIKNLGGVLAEAGMGFDEVLKCTLYMIDLEDFQAANEVYAGFFNEPYPARATVEVSRLPKGARLEIDLIAGK